jgi:hypothetical protein
LFSKYSSISRQFYSERIQTTLYPRVKFFPRNTAVFELFGTEMPHIGSDYTCLTSLIDIAFMAQFRIKSNDNVTEATSVCFIGLDRV